MRRTRSILLTFILLLFVQPLHAAAARKGWTKLELSHAPAALLQQFDGELIGDYGFYSIVAVPKGRVTELEAHAAKENIRVRARDELDLLQLPGATVDAREGIRGVAADRLIREYPGGKPG